MWILLFASLFTNLVELIPKAALAGLLIVIGAQLVKLAHIKLAWRTGNFVIYAITIVCVVFLNLLEGVAIGLVVAIVFLLVRVVRAPVEVAGRRRAVQAMAGRYRRHVELPAAAPPDHGALEAAGRVGGDVKPERRLHRRLRFEAISDWRRAHETRGGVVAIVETSPAKLHHAHARPPKRHFASDPIGLVPWRSARGKDRGSASVLDRIDEYHRNGAAVLHPHIAGLTDSQDPYELFLTCADSRILPNVITASGPGDLYTVRNLGNLVPTDPDDRSVDAALDFAVNQLGVSSVVVCGHSSCAAMTALLEDDPANTTTPMMRWLENAHDSLVVFRNHHPARRSAESAGYPEADQLSIVNVAVQVERLTRHPILATAVAAADLQVIGIFFDISTARVYEVGPNGIICPDEPADRPVDHESAQ